MPEVPGDDATGSGGGLDDVLGIGGDEEEGATAPGQPDAAAAANQRPHRLPVRKLMSATSDIRAEAAR